jgi:hypothetical protein
VAYHESLQDPRALEGVLRGWWDPMIAGDIDDNGLVWLVERRVSITVLLNYVASNDEWERFLVRRAPDNLFGFFLGLRKVLLHPR